MLPYSCHRLRFHSCSLLWFTSQIEWFQNKHKSVCVCPRSRMWICVVMYLYMYIYLIFTVISFNLILNNYHYSRCYTILIKETNVYFSFQELMWRWLKESSLQLCTRQNTLRSILQNISKWTGMQRPVFSWLQHQVYLRNETNLLFLPQTFSSLLKE